MSKDITKISESLRDRSKIGPKTSYADALLADLLEALDRWKELSMLPECVLGMPAAEKNLQIAADRLIAFYAWKLL